MSQPSGESLAQRLPDLPRWVEARALLLSGDGEVLAVQDDPALALVVWDADTHTAFVIGRPSLAALPAILQNKAPVREVITAWEQAAWLAGALPGWARSRIIVHQLVEPARLPEAPAGRVGFLDPARLSELTLPADLREELESGAAGSRIAAAFVAGQPVSFCYAGAVTETLWDISIDTVPEHRRQGLAALCVAHMIRHMLAEGKRPVWQAARLASGRGEPGFLAAGAEARLRAGG